MTIPAAIASPIDIATTQNIVPGPVPCFASVDEIVLPRRRHHMKMRLLSPRGVEPRDVDAMRG